MAYIISTGETSEGIVINNDSMTVQNGGTVNEATVTQAGFMEVLSGGVANGTIINSAGAIMHVSNGGVANNTLLRATSYYYGGGDMVIFNGGVANSTTISRGHLQISSGGIVNNTVVSGSGNYYAGDMVVLDGGVANSTTVNQGYVYISSGGIANYTIANGGSTFVSSGGVANSTTVNGGNMTVLSGTANDTLIQGGNVYLHDGGTASNTTISNDSGDFGYYGAIYYYDFGRKYYPDIFYDYNKKYGYSYSAPGLTISGSGVAYNTTVNSNSILSVAAGGVANNVVVNGRYYEEEYYDEYYEKTLKNCYYCPGVVVVSGGGVVNSATFNSYGLLRVSSGGVVNSATLAANTWLRVSSGGTATGIVAAGDILFDLAVAPETVLQATRGGVALEIKDGALSGITTVTSGNSITVFSGGTASGITANGGFFYVRSGGVATGIRTNSLFTTYLDNGGNNLETGAIFSDCVISGAILTSLGDYEDGGSAVILAGMTAENPTVSGGTLVISSGGVATNIVWAPGKGRVFAEEGASITYASQYSGVYYNSNGSDFNVEIASGLYCQWEDTDGSTNIYVMSGGTAVNAVANSYYGEIYVWDGGTADDTKVNGGILNISSGGVANRTTVNYVLVDDDWERAGTLYISNGGVANDTLVNGKGLLHISSGGIASNTFVSGIDTDSYYVEEDDYRTIKREFGSMFVSSGGTAVDTVVENGLVTVLKGGVMSNVSVTTTSAYTSAVTTATFYSDEYDERVSSAYLTPGIHLGAGGKLTGKMTFLNGAKVFGVTGAILDFDLTQTVAGADALLNDLSAVDGPMNYTITIDGTQADGVYLLAGNVSIFTNVIAVTNTAGKQIGVMLVGQTYTYGNTDYTLTLEDAGLTVTVQGAGGSVGPVADGPKVLSVTADITTATNMDVLVTATFSENSVIKQYSLDGENWGTYAGGVLFGANLTAYFRSIDAAGNISEVASYSVTNIDRTAPGKPVASADVTEPTNRSVTVSATFDEDSIRKEYSLDGETWQEYTNDGVQCIKNETVSFRGIDEAGNASEITTYNVDNIVDVEVNDGPDNGENNSLMQNGEVNPDISSENFVEEETDELFVDPEFSVGVEVDGTEYHNCVGKEDPADYARITLESAAKLSFKVDATDKVKVTLYSIVDGKKGAAMKSLTSVSLSKAGQKDSKEIFLEAGEYYIGVESKNKKADETFYNVELNNGCTVYSDGDSGDNNWLYDSKTKEWNEYVTGAPAIVLDKAALGQSIQLDDYVPSKPGYENFVGFGDAADVRKVVLENDAKLSFDVSLTGGEGKFLVYYKDAKGKMATVKDLTTTFKTSGSTKKAAVLNAGTYYLAFQSSNAKKGNEVYYNVKLNAGSVIYTDGDSGTNDYDSKGKKVSNEVRADATGLEAGMHLQFDGVLDADAGLDIDHNGYTNFVGTGDVSDVLKINAAAGDSLSLKVKATDSVNLVLYGLKNGKVSAIKTVKAKSGEGTLSYTLKAKDGSEFFVGVEAANAKKGSAAYYKVEVVSFSGLAVDALAMPEADTLAMTDSLSFGQSGADMLADASAFDKLAAFDDASAWQSMLA